MKTCVIQMQKLIKQIDVKFKYISFFPLLVFNKKNSDNVKKIYTKHWLYCMCLSELIFLQKNDVSFFCKPTIINLKIKKNKTTILRSPNKHKVAQFHTVKKIFQSYFFISFFFNKKNQYSNIVELRKIFNAMFLNFETALLFTKFVKINFLLQLELKKIK